MLVIVQDERSASRVERDNWAATTERVMTMTDEMITGLYEYSLLHLLI